MPVCVSFYFVGIALSLFLWALVHGLVAIVFERYVVVAGKVQDNFGKGGDSKADASLLPSNHTPSEPFGSRNENLKRSVLGFWTSKNEARG